MRFLILFLLVGSSAHATCEEDLSIDQRYDKILSETSARSREEGRALTFLMNEAISPTLRQVSAHARTLTREQIAVLAKDFHSRGSAYFDDMNLAMGPEDSILGFDAKFEGIGRVWPSKYSFVKHNHEVMRRLNTAAQIFSEEIRVPISYEPDAQLADADQFLSERSFTMTDVHGTISLGADALLQAVAGLTADEIPGLSAEEVLEKIVTPQSRRPSILIQYALMLPPALLGFNGSYIYLRNPLTIGSDGELSFTPHFKEFQKKNRARFAAEEHRNDNEFGFGCPVAHCAPSAAQPALQDFFEAIMYLYRNLPADL